MVMRIEDMRRRLAIAKRRLLDHADEETPEIVRRAEEDAFLDVLYEELLATPAHGPLSDEELAHARAWNWAQAEWAMENGEPDLPSPDYKARFLSMLAIFQRARRKRRHR